MWLQGSFSKFPTMRHVHDDYLDALRFFTVALRHSAVKKFQSLRTAMVLRGTMRLACQTKPKTEVC